MRRILVLVLALAGASSTVSGAAPASGPAARHAGTYELTGRRADGAPVTIDVNGGRWVETTVPAPGVVMRTVVDRTHVVRYGPFGDVYAADRGAESAYRIRAALLTGTLPAPATSQTFPGPGGSTRYEQYRAPHAIPLEVRRVNGALTEASMDGWFDYRGFRVDERGVVTGWDSANGDRFTGTRTAAIPAAAAFAEPPIPKLEDGDPTVAEFDGQPAKVLIDTGMEGLGVSPALAARGTPVEYRLPALGVAGRGTQRLVRFGAFRQLGVTRSGQLARIVEELPEGYDAVEGLGMFPHLALHLGRDHTVLADRRGCRSGLTFSSWAGVVTAIVRVTGAPIPFYGWAMFDTGLDGPVMQITFPPRLAAASKRERLIDETYVGFAGAAKARCTARPVAFHMTNLGTVSHPVCYVADTLVNTLGPAIHSSVVANPVEFLGAPTTIDDVRKLICRTSEASSNRP